MRSLLIKKKGKSGRLINHLRKGPPLPLTVISIYEHPTYLGIIKHLYGPIMIRSSLGKSFASYNI